MRLTGLKKTAVKRLVLLDYVAALLAWLLFWGYRHYVLGDLDYWLAWETFGLRDYVMSLVIIPGGWLLLYLLSGTYFDLYRKSRLDEINRTLISCILGSVIVALIIFADDAADYAYFIKISGRYLFIHTASTLFLRMLLLNHIKSNLIEGKVGFNTLIIGGNQKAIDIYQKVKNSPKVLGNIFKGFIYSTKEKGNGMSKHLPQLGHLSEFEQIIDEHKIEEVIVAVDSSEHHLLENILTRLSYRPVVVKIQPDLYDILSGAVKTSNVYDAVLIQYIPQLDARLAKSL